MKQQFFSLNAIVTAIGCITLLSACISENSTNSAPRLNSDASNDTVKQLSQFNPSTVVAVDTDLLAAQVTKSDRYAPLLDKTGEENSPHGIYQLALKDDGSALYVAIAGVVKSKFTGEPEANRLPGAVFKLNPDTMLLEKEIPLPYQAHGIATQGNRVIATHTRVPAFSFIDNDVLTSTFKADTMLNGDEYRGRYIQFGENGDFFINYYAGETGVIMKYNRNGNHDASFVSNPFVGMSLSLLVDGDKVYTGRSHVRSVDARTGLVQSLSEQVGAVKTTGDDEDYIAANFYGFIKVAPGKLVGLHFGDEFLPNLHFFDIPNKKITSLKTGTNALEARYINGNLIATTSWGVDPKENKTAASITVLPLSKDLQFTKNNFVNIKTVDGIPTNMTAHQSKDGGTDIFVSLKWGKIAPGQYISKVHLAKDFAVVNGKAVGECKVSTVSMTELIKPKPKFIEQNKDCRFVK